ncbi:hypothetical protein [Saccharopolyspora gregorii]|uniref:Uncharacterized protein n=1 Tax=Saccharopolyspora gregorii TaxID=33914 RepID=A0ABP6RRW4_9PSEU|nr:hypothetical protein [Saccharopolyspora gregorii]
MSAVDGRGGLPAPDRARYGTGWIHLRSGDLAEPARGTRPDLAVLAAVLTRLREL